SDLLAYGILAEHRLFFHQLPSANGSFYIIFLPMPSQSRPVRWPRDAIDLFKHICPHLLQLGVQFLHLGSYLRLFRLHVRQSQGVDGLLPSFLRFSTLEIRLFAGNFLDELVEMARDPVGPVVYYRLL